LVYRNRGNMKNLRVMILIVTALSAIAFAQAVDQAQKIRTEAQVQTPPPHWHDLDPNFMKAFHHPAENVQMGLDIRLRGVYARNIYSLNDDYGGDKNYNNYHWQRYRSRLSTKWMPDEDITFNSRLTWEFWTHTDPQQSFNYFYAQQDTALDEAIFDNLNIQFRNAFDSPWTFTLGRQDIMLGTGWLVMDGTPADGSRTFFFDALRGTYDFSDKTKLDLIYIQQYDDEEQYIEPFNHHSVQDRRHLTQKVDERGFIAYLTNKTDSGQQRELYYMYKDDQPSDWSRTYSTPSGQFDEIIHTFGGRLSGPLDKNWSYSSELAKQFGDRNGDTMMGLGTNNKLMYAFNDEHKNELHVGYEYLSGDDKDSGKNEEFDTMWGDWPQPQRGGDLQTYIWAFEGALGRVTNLHRLGFGHSFKPATIWTFATDYNLLWADENSEIANANPSSSDGLTFSDSGKFRGQMISAIATYSCCANFKTHFMLDYFIPGDYYASPSDDNAYFARINVEWTF
jgi:hypothetical protein